MIKRFIALTLWATLVACTQSNQNSNPTSDEKSDVTMTISSLEIADFPSTTLEFADLSLTKSSDTKVVLVENKSESPLNLSGAQTLGEGFSIKLNRCPVSLPAGKSCLVTLMFSSRSLYSGTYNGAFNIGGSADMQLTGDMTQKDDPASHGVPNLQFTFTSFSDDSSSIKEIEIINVGDGNAKEISAQIDQNYSIRLNRCPSVLKPLKTCTIQVMYKNHRNSTPSELDSGSLQVSYKTPVNVVKNSQVDLFSGEYVGTQFAKSISAGRYSNCLISTFGKGFCWGANEVSMQVGNNSQTGTAEPNPVALSEINMGSQKKFVQIATQTMIYTCRYI